MVAIGFCMFVCVCITCYNLDIRHPNKTTLHNGFEIGIYFKIEIKLKAIDVRVCVYASALNNCEWSELILASCENEWRFRWTFNIVIYRGGVMLLVVFTWCMKIVNKILKAPSHRVIKSNKLLYFRQWKQDI